MDKRIKIQAIKQKIDKSQDFWTLKLLGLGEMLAFEIAKLCRKKFVCNNWDTVLAVVLYKPSSSIHAFRFHHTSSFLPLQLLTLLTLSCLSSLWACFSQRWPTIGRNTLTWTVPAWRRVSSGSKIVLSDLYTALVKNTILINTSNNFTK